MSLSVSENAAAQSMKLKGSEEELPDPSQELAPYAQIKNAAKGENT